MRIRPLHAQGLRSGEPTRITREDGSYVEYDYDAAWRVAGERRYDAADTLLGETTYTFDQDGNRLTRTRDGVTETYAYGPGFRLETVTGAGGEAFTYDGASRVTSIDRDGETSSLAYDSQDQLVGHVGAGGASSYHYDGAGRRVGVVDAAGERRYLVAPSLGEGFESPHLVTDASGAAVAEYVYAGEHALSRTETGTTTYYLRDAMGSVIVRDVMSMVDSKGHPENPSAAPELMSSWVP